MKNKIINILLVLNCILCCLGIVVNIFSCHTGFILVFTIILLEISRVLLHMKGDK